MKILKQVCIGALFTLGYDIKCVEESPDYNINEEASRERAFNVVEKGMSSIMQCLLSIVGGDDYTRIVDQHKTVQTPVEESKKLPYNGEEIPEEAIEEDKVS